MAGDSAYRLSAPGKSEAQGCEHLPEQLFSLPFYFLKYLFPLNLSLQLR